MWKVAKTQDAESLYDDLVTAAIHGDHPRLPDHDLKIGNAEAHWHLVGSKAFIATNPEVGTSEDRVLAEQTLAMRLASHGYDQVTWEVDPDEEFRRMATWADVEQKAKQLVQQGRIRIQKNGYNQIVGHVVGDHGVYEPEIHRLDPNSRSISYSTCDCDWGQFQNQPRTRQWRKFQNRMCSHILGTYWLAASMPLDEDLGPGQALPNQGFAGPNTGIMQQAPEANQQMMQQLQQAYQQNPDLYGPMGDQRQNLVQHVQNLLQQQQAAQPPPSPAEALPQFPMEQGMPVNPVSVPGLKGPTPGDPIQFPGQTFSSVRTTVDQQYQNGHVVQLRFGDPDGILQGRSQEHGAGQAYHVPAGSVGEVLGTDPATGLVNVLFMGPQFEGNSYFEPYGATTWSLPSELVHRPDLKPPGANVVRT